MKLTVNSDSAYLALVIALFQKVEAVLVKLPDFKKLRDASLSTLTRTRMLHWNIVDDNRGSRYVDSGNDGNYLVKLTWCAVMSTPYVEEDFLSGSIGAGPEHLVSLATAHAQVWVKGGKVGARMYYAGEVQADEHHIAKNLLQEMIGSFCQQMQMKGLD